MPKKLGLQYTLLLLRFLRFFNPKNVTFYVFFALLHTFSRNMQHITTSGQSRIEEVGEL